MAIVIFRKNKYTFPGFQDVFRKDFLWFNLVPSYTGLSIDLSGKLVAKNQPLPTVSQYKGLTKNLISQNFHQCERKTCQYIQVDVF